MKYLRWFTLCRFGNEKGTLSATKTNSTQHSHGFSAGYIRWIVVVVLVPIFNSGLKIVKPFIYSPLSMEDDRCTREHQLTIRIPWHQHIHTGITITTEMEVSKAQQSNSLMHWSVFLFRNEQRRGSYSRSTTYLALNVWSAKFISKHQVCTDAFAVLLYRSARLQQQS